MKECIFSWINGGTQMNMINRHNYEEFFLMYVDNELDNQERSAVESFVQQNPDLQSEFDMLLQTKLDAGEDITFAHKTDLLKIKDSIAMDNYEEYFLLYIDNELNEDGREAVEKFVLQHPQLQDGFTLLKQTVLQPDKIVFHDKKSLHRTEEKRVFTHYFTRVMLAAALLCFAFMIWWLVPGRKVADTPVAVTRPAAILPGPEGREDSAGKTVTEPGPLQLAAKDGTVREKNARQALAKTEISRSQSRSLDPVKMKKVNDSYNSGIVVSKMNDEAVKPAPQEQPPKETEAKFNNNEPVIALADPDKESELEDPLEKVKSVNAMNHPDTKYFIHPALYKELNTEEDGDANAFYIGNMEINKNKVRGLMKKVGGLFAGKSRNSSDEKGKLQIASFELNTN